VARLTIELRWWRSALVVSEENGGEKGKHDIMGGGFIAGARWWGSVASRSTCSACRQCDGGACGTAAMGVRGVADHRAWARCESRPSAGWWVWPVIFFNLNFSSPVEFCKLTKLSFPNSKIHQLDDSLNKKEQLFFWDEIQITNGSWITNSGSE
jgi:hypothetical protein